MSASDEGGDPTPYSLKSLFGVSEWEEIPTTHPWVMMVLIYIAFTVVTVVVVSAVSFLMFPVLFAYAIPYIEPWLPLWWFKTILVAAMLLISYAFFLFRKHVQWLYGPVETVVGVVICWAALHRDPTEHLGFALGVGTGIYVVVRGMTNFDDGMKKIREEQEQLDRLNADRNQPRGGTNLAD